MSNKMLIDATHPEETRVVVLRGNRVEEFDFEAAEPPAASRQHLSRQGHPGRAVAAGGLRRLRRQPPRLPRLLRNPPRLLPDPVRRPAGAAGGRARARRRSRTHEARRRDRGDRRRQGGRRRIGRGRQQPKSASPKRRPATIAADAAGAPSVERAAGADTWRAEAPAAFDSEPTGRSRRSSRRRDVPPNRTWRPQRRRTPSMREHRRGVGHSHDDTVEVGQRRPGRERRRRGRARGSCPSAASRARASTRSRK